MIYGMGFFWGGGDDEGGHITTEQSTITRTVIYNTLIKYKSNIDKRMFVMDYVMAKL